VILYSLKHFLNIYIPQQEDNNKAQVLHLLVLGMAMFASLQMILSKIYEIYNYLIGNGQKFIDDTSRFL